MTVGICFGTAAWPAFRIIEEFSLADEATQELDVTVVPIHDQIERGRGRNGLSLPGPRIVRADYAPGADTPDIEGASTPP